MAVRPRAIIFRSNDYEKRKFIESIEVAYIFYSDHLRGTKSFICYKKTNTVKMSTTEQNKWWKWNNTNKYLFQFFILLNQLYF